MTITVNLTVAIPTYNGENRLPKVLDKLKEQIEAEDINWEVIVVDNNSTDGTAKVVKEYQENWLKDVPLKYCFEPEQGFPFARQKAISQAQGELIGFLDDDNLPSDNWVKAAYTFAEKYPQVGAFSSKIVGVFETEPSEEIKPILFYLALVDRGSQPLMYEPRKKGLPPGAGLVVRREVWQKCVPERLFLVGRAGTSIMPAGEDAEALLYIYKAGWEIWYNPNMEIKHLIPTWRLQKTYLMRLMRSIGLGRFHLRMLLLEWWQKPLVFLFYLINDSRKLILHLIRYRSELVNNIVAQCEQERLIGTLLSPFYLTQIKFKNVMKLY
jgi:glycosyltransferase involved in cell wall biosynthesis